MITIAEDFYRLYNSLVLTGIFIELLYIAARIAYEDWRKRK